MTYRIDSFPGREILLNNTSYLYFGGTAYLGLQTDTDFQDLYIKNIKKYGTNYGASRKSNVQIGIYDQAENYLAKLVGSEACVSMSSGYLAGQFVAQFLQSSAFFYAPNTHSALYVANQSDNNPKTYTTYTSLNIALLHHLEKNKSTPIVFLDSIGFSGVNFPDFSSLQSLPLDKIILVVDDSHGIGIVGDNGGGVFTMIQKLQPKELYVCCSLGKGFGVQGGAIFSTKSNIENLKKTDFYGGASPAAPANLASIFYAEEILRTKRQVLTDNMELFLNNLSDSSLFKYMKGHPAFSFSDEKLTQHLETNKILVTSFKYPNEDSKLMSRIVISAGHTSEDIIRLCEVLNSF